MTFTATATDSASASASQSFTIAVLTGSVLTTSLPHFAAGGGYVMEFYVLNNSGQAASFAIISYTDSGQAIAVPLTGFRTRAILADTVPANGAKYYEAGTAGATLISGSASISANTGITIQAIVPRLGADGSYYEAAIAPATGYNEFQIPFDSTTFAPTGEQIYMGFAISNLDTTKAANVTCSARDGDGNTIPNAVPTTPLSPLGHWAKYLFPDLTGLRGTIDCSSNTKIGAVALRFIGANAFSSLPVIPIR